MTTKKKKTGSYPKIQGPSQKSTYPKLEGWEIKELRDEFFRGPEVSLLREPSKPSKRKKK